MDTLEVLLALRNRLLGTVVAETGVVPLAGTGNGFTRANGSFITDGFKVGMEVVPAGFADNTPSVITSVSALEITVAAERAVEAEDPNRSLTVGIPPMRGWENKRLDPVAGRWYIEEDFLPGPKNQVTVGIKGQVEHLPTYVLRLSGLSGEGVSALYKVSDAILDRFPIRLAMPMSDGMALRVQSEPGPNKGQVLPGTAGRAEIVITIPLWKRTHNPI